ncbi:MAG: hypothetical protein A3I09_00430 [Deltaproteobacteria bacterium RIFCSPLOWO2_02_FULL_47_10]|nr:MAG: hypothetical protein A3I09_00430 [Deltaproteobacteria bacterium RIFCSPLOWO2_02_FULL_47_10]
MMKYLLISILFLTPISSFALENSDCFNCHTEVTQAKFVKSIHGKHLCTSCHADIEDAPHSKKPGPVTCEKCHRIEQQIYLNSDHGRAVAKGIKKAASCKACHGEHHYLLDYRNPESPVSRNKINETCARCHDDLKKMEPYHLTQREPYKSYLKSIHGEAFKSGEAYAAICTDCHGSHDLHSPINPESRIYKFNVPKTCSKCHENVFNTYKMSVHAKGLYAGVRDAPVCTDCHGEHTIQTHTAPTSSTYPSSIVKTCSHCHASEKITIKYGLPPDVINTYMESYHGTAYQYGSIVAANCASCHGFHDILPSSDERSSINPANIGNTCGKCHPNAGEQLSKGSVHVRPSVNRDKIIYYVTLFYVILIILTIGGMLIHNLLDLLKKAAAHYRKSALEGISLRLTKGERIQHIILLICFITLVYTGFAHKYPKAFFSYPFSFPEWGPEIRKIIHRVAGTIFMLLMLYHGAWLVCTEYGRKKLAALLPCIKDIKNAIGLITYNLGMREERPKFDRYSYIEKAEYWALIWGSFIMIITGLVLMFENVSLQYLPKWLIDVMLVIHFFEALLASLAIVVWHFYWVIFDPHTYPMNWSWITGKVRKKHE